MSFIIYKQVSLGASRSGLATVGYALYDAAGAVAAARSTVGIAERGATGTYGAIVTFPDNFVGEIRWDSGEAAPRTASEEINPGGISEYLDNRITSRPDAAAIDTQLTSAHGAGPWTQPTIPTPPSAAAISNQVGTDLAASHGAGAWTQPAIPTPPTPAAISSQVNADMTTAHGAGDWTRPAVPSVVDIDAQLTSTHGNGSWVTPPTLATPPSPADIDAALTASHGAGPWTGGGTTEPGTPTSVPVDHDTGGTDALRYVNSSGIGISGASILIYRKADWDSGLRDSTRVVDSTATRSDGRWANVVQLEPGDYVVMISYPGYQASITYITV